jgi:hypothetical protein
VTRFVLGDERSRLQTRTNSPRVAVTIEGGGDAIGWLLSETQVRMPAADDPRWLTTRPTALDLSADDGVKRVLLWRTLPDGTVSTRPEVATIEIVHQ